MPTRRAAEELAERLTAAGFPARSYHGGMAGGPREQRHEEFLADEVPIMVATSAFGMGIDKPNIRWVAHMALPDSPDSYLQEIGRAGRDGQPSRALLLWRAEDTGLHRFFNGGRPDAHELERLATALQSGPVRSTKKIAQLIGLLEDVGASGMAPAQAAKAAMAEADRRSAMQNSRIEMMLGFAQAKGCRTRELLAYFGEHMPQACNHCDNCASGTVVAEEVTEDQPFPVHSTVRHPQWGAGLVLSYAEDKMTILFDEVGYKTLSVPVVKANGLLVR